MHINKVIYQTNEYEVVLQKYSKGWLLTVSEGYKHIEWKEFGMYETAHHYAKNKYLGGE